MSKDYKQNVPAQDTKTVPHIWNLTKSQWALYYWLLTNSYWNSIQRENHYFIYKSDYTLKQIRADTGIKSDNTIRTAYAKLEEVGAIEYNSMIKAYYIYWGSLFVPMKHLILKCLLAFHDYIDPSILITSFSILVRLNEGFKNRNERLTFTKSEFGQLMNLSKQNVDEAGIIVAFAVLKGLGLIELKESYYTNRLGVQCIQYEILNAYPNSDNLEFLMNNDDTVDMNKVHKLWEICLNEYEVN